MKRERPPMPPLRVRVLVIKRMLRIKKDWGEAERASAIWTFAHLGSDTKRIEIGLSLLGLTGAHLDHDPALILRPYNPRIKNVARRYTPHAHDPDALIYREKADHQQKTTGRKPGALKTVTTKGSDIGLKTKFARLENPRRPRTTITPRGFGKGRKQKIPSRPFQKRKSVVDKAD